MQSRPRSGVVGKLTTVARLGADRGFPRPDLKTIARQVRVAVTPRNSLLKAQLASGAVVYGKNRPGFGGRAVYVYGDATEPEFEHLDSFLDDTGVFIDIGANTGKWAIKAAKRFGDTGVVIAIEPFPDILATMYRSVQANRFSNVRLRNVTIGDRTGEGTLWMNNARPQMFSLEKSDEGASRFSTLTVTLDDLFGWERLERLDYLKIDAEGSEEKVLNGGRQTISKHRPIIQIEATLNDIPIGQPDYSCFKAERSSGKVYMPNEHPKIDLPTRLGWARLS